MLHTVGSSVENWTWIQSKLNGLTFLCVNMYNKLTAC